MTHASDGVREVKIIGIDCSAVPGNTGLALASCTRDQITILKVQNDSSAKKDKEAKSPFKILAKWLKEEKIDLLAFDAPLGWPIDLAAALRNHEAGAPFAQSSVDGTLTTSHSYFRRLTDNAISDRLGKRPLDVGADRIARTAYATLKLLGDLREKTKKPIPLAWDHEALSGTHAIEVYPAATRKARQQTKESHRLEGLGNISTEGIDLDSCSPHELDAIICAVAGWDFIRGDACGPTPEELPRAKREGWIWAANTRTIAGSD